MTPVVKVAAFCALMFSHVLWGRVTPHSLDLPLTCFSVPSTSDSICSARTYAENNISTDLLLYRANKVNHLQLLYVSRADIAIQWLWGISPAGKYLVLVSSEEGHSTYVFFRTDDVLDAPEVAFQQPIAVISDYYLSDLIYLHDDGTAVFGRLGGKSEAESLHCETKLAEHFAPRENDSDTCYVDVPLSDWSVSKAR